MVAPGKRLGGAGRLTTQLVYGGAGWGIRPGVGENGSGEGIAPWCAMCGIRGLHYGANIARSGMLGNPARFQRTVGSNIRLFHNDIAPVAKPAVQ